MIVAIEQEAMRAELQLRFEQSVATAPSTAFVEGTLDAAQWVTTYTDLIHHCKISPSRLPSCMICSLKWWQSLSDEAINLARIPVILWEDTTWRTVDVQRIQAGAYIVAIWSSALPENIYTTLQQLYRQILEQEDYQRLTQAVALQQQWLPQLPAHIPYVIDYVYQPASQFSGDVFDSWLTDDEQHLLFYVADVAGHGIVANQVATLFKAQHQGFQHVDAFIVRMNDMLKQFKIKQHVTCIAGILHRHTGEGLLWNAGHFPSPFIVEKEHITLVEAAEAALPLGVSRSVTHTPIAFTLPMGATLVLASDGVLEAFAGGIDLQCRAFMESMTQLTHLEHPCQTWWEQHQADIVSHEYQRCDDTTLLCIRRVDGSSH